MNVKYKWICMLSIVCTAQTKQANVISPMWVCLILVVIEWVRWVVDMILKIISVIKHFDIDLLCVCLEHFVLSCQISRPRLYPEYRELCPLLQTVCSGQPSPLRLFAALGLQTCPPFITLVSSSPHPPFPLSLSFALFLFSKHENPAIKESFPANHPGLQHFRCADYWGNH